MVRSFRASRSSCRAPDRFHRAALRTRAGDRPAKPNLSAGSLGQAPGRHPCPSQPDPAYERPMSAAALYDERVLRQERDDEVEGAERSGRVWREPHVPLMAPCRPAELIARPLALRSSASTAWASRTLARGARGARVRRARASADRSRRSGDLCESWDRRTARRSSRHPRRPGPWSRKRMTDLEQGSFRSRLRPRSRLAGVSTLTSRSLRRLSVPPTPAQAGRPPPIRRRPTPVRARRLGVPRRAGSSPSDRSHSLPACSLRLAQRRPELEHLRQFAEDSSSREST